MLIPVSVIFITMFVGGMISAALNVYVTDRLGFGIVSGEVVTAAKGYLTVSHSFQVSSLGTFCFMIGYAISSSGGPYPLFALSFVFNGIGFGFQVRGVGA